MTFTQVPVRLTRFQNVIILVAIVVWGIFAIRAFWTGDLRNGGFSLLMAIFPVFAWWHSRNRTPLRLEMDESSIQLIRDSSILRSIAWTRVETIRDDETSLAIYYKDGNEPRLFMLASSTFALDEWREIRAFLLSKDRLTKKQTSH